MIWDLAYWTYGFTIPVGQILAHASHLWCQYAGLSHVGSWHVFVILRASEFGFCRACGISERLFQRPCIPADGTWVIEVRLWSSQYGSILAGNNNRHKWIRWENFPTVSRISAYPMRTKLFASAMKVFGWRNFVRYSWFTFSDRMLSIVWYRFRSQFHPLVSHLVNEVDHNRRVGRWCAPVHDLHLLRSFTFAPDSKCLAYCVQSCTLTSPKWQQKWAVYGSL